MNDAEFAGLERDYAMFLDQVQDEDRREDAYLEFEAKKRAYLAGKAADVLGTTLASLTSAPIDMRAPIPAWVAMIEYDNGSTAYLATTEDAIYERVAAEYCRPCIKADLPQTEQKRLLAIKDARKLVAAYFDVMGEDEGCTIESIDLPSLTDLVASLVNPTRLPAESP